MRVLGADHPDTLESRTTSHASTSRVVLVDGNVDSPELKLASGHPRDDNAVCDDPGRVTLRRRPDVLAKDEE